MRTVFSVRWQDIYIMRAGKVVGSGIFLSRSYYPNIFSKGLGRNIININHCQKIVTKIQDKGKAIAIQPGQGSTKLRLPEFVDNWHTWRQKVVSPMHWLPLPSRRYSWYSFLLEAESTPCGQKVKSMKIPSGCIGNQTCSLPSCRAVPQQSAPLCTPQSRLVFSQIQSRSANRNSATLPYFLDHKTHHEFFVRHFRKT